MRATRNATPAASPSGTRLSLCSSASLQTRARSAWSLSALAALLRQQLFVDRDRWLWVEETFQSPPLLTDAARQMLHFASANFYSTNANLNRQSMATA